MTTLAPVKRGDTFSIYVDLYDANNAPLIVTTNQIRCEIRSDYDKLVDTLAVAMTATPGRYELTSADTSNWMVGDLYSDIEITIGAVTKSSDSFIIPVVKDVTRNE